MLYCQSSAAQTAWSGELRHDSVCCKLRRFAGGYRPDRTGGTRIESRIVFTYLIFKENETQNSDNLYRWHDRND